MPRLHQRAEIEAVIKPRRIQDRALLDSYHAKPCAICRRVPSDPCHIRSRGAGGDDVPSNLIPLCREHHTEQHKLGWRTFLMRHPAARLVFHGLGWRLDVYGAITRQDGE